MALIRCPECGREISSLAKVCPHCGCPIHTADLTETAEKTEGGLFKLQKPDPKKIRLILLADVAAVVVMAVAVTFGVVLPKQRALAYEKAIDLLETGNYAEGQSALMKLGDYKDAQEILEQTQFEVLAFSAIEDLRNNLKKPESLHVYSIDLYHLEKRTNDKVTIGESISLDKPMIVINYSAQNGFGGNTDEYYLSGYSVEEERYIALGNTKSLDLDRISQKDQNSNEYLTTEMIQYLESECSREGSVNVQRINKILKYEAYSVVRSAA